MPDVTRQVQDFYDRVGWRQEKDGCYQNTRYEDLRPVAAEYIHRCHLRVNRFIRRKGRFLLDAGSGPIQYPEYLTYSQGYKYRVCLDLSRVALKEARRRIGNLGLFVVADVSWLPFKSDVFDGIVSLHTLHHLPLESHLQAYEEMHRTLTVGSAMVVVNGWTDSPLMRRVNWLISLAERVRDRLVNPRREIVLEEKPDDTRPPEPTGTYVAKQNAAWLKAALNGKMKYEIRVWRSVSVRFLRALVHGKLGGRIWLRLLFWLEERFPHWFGEKGQYPLIIVRK